MTSDGRIVLFDSGVGGLVIYSELRKILPSLSYVYCLDNAYYPYGTKDDVAIVDRVCKLVPQLVDKYRASVLVVACNTASTIALEQIRKSVSIPVIGVVPAVKVAARLTKTKSIGLLATEATVRRNYTDKLIAEFAADCEVMRLGSRKLVDIAEAKVRGEALDLSEIEQELRPFFERASLDTVVLACTHFDHLHEEFTKLAPRPLAWVSSAKAVALHTKSLIEGQALNMQVDQRSCLVTTRSDLRFEEALRKLYGFDASETLLVP